MRRLSEIKPGQECIVEEIHGGWGLMRRLTEIGLFRGVRVNVLSSDPWGGPVYIEILPIGARCSLGHGVASGIMVRAGDGVSGKTPGSEADVQDHAEEHGRICRQKHRPGGCGRGWRFWRRRG